MTVEIAWIALLLLLLNLWKSFDTNAYTSLSIVFRHARSVAEYLRDDDFVRFERWKLCIEQIITSHLTTAMEPHKLS